MSKEKIIVALDVSTAREAFDLFSRLRDVVDKFKIGSQLFTAHGQHVVREVTKFGGKIFLDLKFHDIPNTVAAASVEAARLGVFMFNVHASGGSEMMKRTVDAVNETSAKENLIKPNVIAVTVLTSSTKETLNEIGIDAEPLPQVVRLARLAEACGMDGVVASPHEVMALRENIENKNFLIVTPGVRPAGTSHDDQKRVMTPSEAVRAGADYLVIGRAITNASDPSKAAQKIIEEIEGRT
jgi:orotidine-5'-phosphate decarboxylase